MVMPDAYAAGAVAKGTSTRNKDGYCLDCKRGQYKPHAPGCKYLNHCVNLEGCLLSANHQGPCVPSKRK